ncbi:MAG: hypothetical protein JWR09_2811 [Mucilaginibacter sp.]|nr:hypothetical protein [Mucilaginibacter sp.]
MLDMRFEIISVNQISFKNYFKDLEHDLIYLKSHVSNLRSK